MNLLAKINDQAIKVAKAEMELKQLCKEYADKNRKHFNTEEVKIIDNKVTYIVTDAIYDHTRNKIVYGLQQKGYKYSHYKTKVDESDILKI